MACGSGKTLTSYWINKLMWNFVTIICVPSLHLLSQFYKDWAIQSYDEGMEYKFILIGSDNDDEDGEIAYK